MLSYYPFIYWFSTSFHALMCQKIIRDKRFRYPRVQTKIINKTSITVRHFVPVIVVQPLLFLMNISSILIAFLTFKRFNPNFHTPIIHQLTRTSGNLQKLSNIHFSFFRLYVCLKRQNTHFSQSLWISDCRTGRD